MLVIMLSRKLRLLGLISVTWRGSFPSLAPVHPPRLLQLQLKGLKSQCGLCSFSRKVKNACTNGKMLHSPWRKLGKAFFPMWDLPIFNLYQWPVWICSLSVGEMFLDFFFFFCSFCTVPISSQKGYCILGFRDLNGVCELVVTWFLLFIQTHFLVLFGV